MEHKNLWDNLEPVINEDNKSPRDTFVNILLCISDNVRARPGLYEFLFNAPKKINFDSESWRSYQERIYSVISALLEDGIKKGEFPNLDPQLLFKALGGLFMGLVLMGNKNEPKSENDIEKLIEQLITDPTKKV